MIDYTLRSALIVHPDLATFISSSTRFPPLSAASVSCRMSSSLSKTRLFSSSFVPVECSLFAF